MTYTTPKYGLQVPSPATRLNQLGTQLQQMGVSIEDVLDSFDYNGADPNLVLSRVAALEADLDAAQQSLDTLLNVQNGISPAFSVPGNSSASYSVTFDTPFAMIPDVSVAQASPGTNNVIVLARSVSSTGFLVYARNFSSAAYNVSGRWTARAQ